MTDRTLDATIWALIYAGLGALVLGVVLHRAHAGLGWGLGVIGIGAVAAGIALLWHRSRRAGSDPGP